MMSPDTTPSSPGKQRRGLYLYGIAEGPLEGPVGLTGVGEPPGEVLAIPYYDVAAIVSETSDADPAPTRRNVFAHQRVLLSLMEQRTVIPVSFGNVLSTSTHIGEILKGGYDSFKGTFEFIRGKIEVGLVVSWTEEAFKEELRSIGKGLASIRKARRQTRKRASSSLQTAISTGEAAAEALSERSSRIRRAIHDKLKPHAASSRLCAPLGERTIINAAYLVDRRQEAAFDQAVSEIAAEIGDRFEFRYTGPWPPYNFVDIKLTLASPE